MTNNYQVHEEFLGLYNVDSIDAATITFVISGVVKRISELEPRTTFTHCYGHALNFAACDTLKKSKVTKNALELTHEITKLIKCSPRREGIFQNLKETIPSSGRPGI